MKKTIFLLSMLLGTILGYDTVFAQLLFDAKEEVKEEIKTAPILNIPVVAPVKTTPKAVAVPKPIKEEIKTTTEITNKVEVIENKIETTTPKIVEIDIDKSTGDLSIQKETISSGVVANSGSIIENKPLEIIEQPVLNLDKEEQPDYNDIYINNGDTITISNTQNTIPAEKVEKTLFRKIINWFKETLGFEVYEEEF